MSGLDLATGNVIIFLPLQGCNLSLGEYGAFFSDLRFERFESEFEARA